MYPPKHPKNASKHWCPQDPAFIPGADCWPGDTVTIDGDLYQLDRSGTVWHLVSLASDRAAE